MVKAVKDKKSVLADIGAARGDSFRIEPEKIVIVGWDEGWPIDDEDPACDITRLAKLRDTEKVEALARALIAAGNIQAINIVISEDKDGNPVIKALSGRRRVLAGRLANKMLIEAGQPPSVRIKCMPPEKGDNATLFGIVVGENQNREDDLPSAKAKQLERLIRMRGETIDAVSKETLDEAAAIFGVDHSTLKNWLVIPTLAKPVVEMIDSGAMPQNAARELKDLPKNEQVEQANKLLTENGGANLLQRARTIANKAKGKKGDDEHEGLTRGQLLGVLRLIQEDKLEGKESKLKDDAEKMLAAVLGKRPVEQVAGLKHYLERLVEEAKQRAEKRAKREKAAE